MKSDVSRYPVMMPGSRLNGAAYTAVYLTGAVGFVLDVLGHQDHLASHLPGHLVMAAAAAGVIILLSVPWDRSLGAKLSLTGVAFSALAIIGQVIPAFAPFLALAIVLVLPRALRLRGRRPPEGRAFFLAAAGLWLILVGGVVDAIHHAIEDPAGAFHGNEDVLAMPGHQIQLLGWLVGMVGGQLLARRRPAKTMPISR